MQVNILEAKNRLSQLIKSAQAGEVVVIANRGEPVVQLVATRSGSLGKAASQGSADAPSPSDGFLQWLRDNPLPGHAQRSHEEIEAGIRQERDAWD